VVTPHSSQSHLGYLRLEFARSQREQRIISNTASGAGYHTANLAQHYVQTALPADGGFLTAVANLATATSSDRETFAVLTKKIATLTDQLAAKDILGKSQEAEIKCLVSGRANTRAGAAPAPAPAAAYVRKSYKTKNDNYCWSHGYQIGLAHNSANCTKKAPGHKDAATKDNIMGGDTWGRKIM
jgi:hypothetical protein